MHMNMLFTIRISFTSILAFNTFAEAKALH